MFCFLSLFGLRSMSCWNRKSGSRGRHPRVVKTTARYLKRRQLVLMQLWTCSLSETCSESPQLPIAHPLTSKYRQTAGTWSVGVEVGRTLVGVRRRAARALERIACRRRFQPRSLRPLDGVVVWRYCRRWRHTGAAIHRLAADVLPLCLGRHETVRNRKLLIRACRGDVSVLA